MQQCGRVVEAGARLAVRLGKSNQRSGAVENGVLRELLQRRLAARHELRQVHQIPRRIAAQGELGKEHQLRALLGGLARVRHHALRVGREGPYRRVDLRQRDPHADCRNAEIPSRQSAAADLYASCPLQLAPADGKPGQRLQRDQVLDLQP